jgi:glycosyltransferase involved in cell wall biosynthesis
VQSNLRSEFLKIALDDQIFVQKHGGISRYFNQLAHGLIGLEQEIAVFAPFYLNTNLSSLPENCVHGRYVKRYPPKLSRFFSFYNRYISRRQISKWRPDVVHETYYSRLGSSPKDCPTVITVYDMIHEIFKNDFSKKDDTVAVKKIAIDRADHIICISENTKKDLVRLYNIDLNKITVVHLGFDQLIKIDLEQTSENILQNDKPFLLYVGGRWGYKNFSGFLRAVASSKRLLSDFDIISFGVSRFSMSELNLIKSLGFAKNQVRQISGNDALLGQYYHAARAFVYPSLYEGFGIPPLEAMAQNCPVISSNSSSMPEVIGAAAEFFDPSSHEDMRNAIERVVYSESRIVDLKKQGIERLNHFSWAQCTRKTLNVYRSLVGDIN